MNTWKKNLVPILFVIGGLGGLIAVVKWAIRGQPLDEFPLSLCLFAITWLLLAYMLYQKSAGTSGPPNT